MHYNVAEMDSITQGLLGAVTAQLGFRQRIGRDAGWAAAATAILADADSYIIRGLGITHAGQADLAFMAYHRGISHSLLAVPVIAAAAAGAWWLLRRALARRSRPARGAEEPGGRSPRPARPSLRLLYACCFVAALSHPLLDLFTSYGTQLLAPITNARYAIDALPIIDIIYTPILILTLLACYVARRLAGNWRRVTVRIAWAGFALSAAYVGAGWAIGRLAIHKAGSVWGPPTGGDRAAEHRASPMIPTIFVWRVVRRTPSKWSAARINVLFDTEATGRSNSEAPVVDNRWVRRARQLAAVRTYDWFAMGLTRATYQFTAGHHVVEFHDMRYSFPPESVNSMWPMRVVFGPEGAVRRTGRQRHFRRGSIGQVLRQAWGYLWKP